MALKQGKPLDALAKFEQAPMKVIFPLMEASPFFSHSDDRFLRAELLKSLGRYEEALQWYRTVPETALYDRIYLAPSHLRQGEIYEELGDQQNAIEHYTRFVELWQSCDPELQTMVDDANTRLEYLKNAMVDDL